MRNVNLFPMHFFNLRTYKYIETGVGPIPPPCPQFRIPNHFCTSRVGGWMNDITVTTPLHSNSAWEREKSVLQSASAINRGRPDHISQSQIEISRRKRRLYYLLPSPPRDLIMWDTSYRGSRMDVTDRSLNYILLYKPFWESALSRNLSELLYVQNPCLLECEAMPGIFVLCLCGPRVISSCTSTRHIVVGATSFNFSGAKR